MVFAQDDPALACGTAYPFDVFGFLGGLFAAHVSEGADGNACIAQGLGEFVPAEGALASDSTVDTGK
jgi:hypothetical protein